MSMTVGRNLQQRVLEPLVVVLATLLLSFSTVAFYHHHDLCGVVHYGFECSHCHEADFDNESSCGHCHGQQSDAGDCPLHASYIKDFIKRECGHFHGTCHCLLAAEVLSDYQFKFDNQYCKYSYNICDDLFTVGCDMAPAGLRGPPAFVC